MQSNTVAANPIVRGIATLAVTAFGIIAAIELVKSAKAFYNADKGGTGREVTKKDVMLSQQKLGWCSAP